MKSLRLKLSPRFQETSPALETGAVSLAFFKAEMSSPYNDIELAPLIFNIEKYQFPGDVIGVGIPVWLGVALVEEWVVHEVPVSLVVPTLGLDVVTEGGAFDEGVVFF